MIETELQTLLENIKVSINQLELTEKILAESYVCDLKDLLGNIKADLEPE